VQHRFGPKHNIGTRAERDKLVIVRKNGSSERTTLVAGLDSGSNPTYSDSSVHIRVCRTFQRGRVDAMEISIGRFGTNCNSNNNPPRNNNSNNGGNGGGNSWSAPGGSNTGGSNQSSGGGGSSWSTWNSWSTSWGWSWSTSWGSSWTTMENSIDGSNQRQSHRWSGNQN